MELAKLSSKGQITIPKHIRQRLRLKEGDKVFFIEEKGKIYFQNASQIALSQFQEGMDSQGQKAVFDTEDDVVNYIKEIRQLR